MHAEYAGPRETAFGDAKRLRVIRAWLAGIRAEEGGRPLSVLDFGCGTGSHLLFPLAVDGDRFHGVDVHEPTIRAAEAMNRLSNVTFSCETAEQLVARGAHFDVIICSEVLEHLHDPAAVLAAFGRMLPPGGALLVTVPNGFGPYENLKRLEKRLDAAGIERFIDYAKWPGRYVAWRLDGRGVPPRPGTAAARCGSDGNGVGFLNFESGHVQFYTLDVLQSLFTSAGFALEEARGRSFICGPYLGFFLNVLARLPGGKAFFTLNNRLADILPLSFASDWMFRLRRT
jgi:SAM-dependent methyltransferase